MKKKQVEKKKRSTVRERDWEKHGETAFSHDLVRHRRAQVKLSSNARELQALPTDFTPNARVVAHSKKWGFVVMDGEELLCRIDERLDRGDSTLIAPGDEVLVEFEEEEPYIRGIAERRNKLSRPGTAKGGPAEQVLATNLDYLLVVAAAADPPFRTGLVDRYLVAAQTGGVEPILCVNKMDLVQEAPVETQLYRDLGIEAHLISCKTGEGLAGLREKLKGKTSVLSGHSGVGKSSLLNALDPDLKLHTQPISGRTGRGQHTTTASRLYELSGNTTIIDTPGIRALGLWGVSPEELDYFFHDLQEFGQGCKFRDCTHTHEPGCAVRDAAECGALNTARLASYLRIRASLESGNNMTPGRTAASWQASKSLD